MSTAGFKWETALVKLSCAELAVYCFEHLLSAGGVEPWAQVIPTAQVTHSDIEKNIIATD